MITSPEVKIFAIAPTPPRTGEQQKGSFGKFWGNLVVIGSAPKLFSESVFIVADMLFVIWAVTIVFSLQHGPLVTLLVVEGLYLLSVLAFFRARKSVDIRANLAYYALILLISILLNIFFSGYFGDVGLYALCGYTLYRFPLRWALPMIILPIVGLVAINNGSDHTTAHTLYERLRLIPPLIIVGIVCWVSWTRRVRHLLIVELQNTQEQLRAQIARTAELATTRERARIARDIHDVLAHTLTILSIQIQAARQLVHQNPEKLPPKLDDMAVLLRESIAESRRVVGLLRETAIAPAAPGSLGQQLQAFVERFGERSGIRCSFEEEGTPQSISEQQSETLQFALKEALTNAHRHGAAHTVKVSLCWQVEDVRLDVRDDGSGSEGKSQNIDGTHNGLRGMRERAKSLGGSLEAGFQPEGGFAVTLSLPLKGVALSSTQGVSNE